MLGLVLYLIDFFESCYIMYLEREVIDMKSIELLSTNKTEYGTINPTLMTFDDFLNYIERYDPKADMGLYTVDELRVMYTEHLKKLDEQRTKDMVRKSNINRILKYIYSWRVEEHLDEETNTFYYNVSNIKAWSGHRFYDCGQNCVVHSTITDSLIKEYRDIIDGQDWLVKDLFLTLVDDIQLGLWSVDLRDREVRTMLNYFKPIFGCDVIQLIIDTRKAKESDDIEPVVDDIDNLVSMSDELFGGDD